MSQNDLTGDSIKSNPMMIRITNLETSIAVIKNELKWIKWLLAIDLTMMISLIVAVAKAIIGGG